MVSTYLSEVVRRAVKAKVRNKVKTLINVDPLIQVKADPDFLFRSLANIIRNAVHHSDKEDVISVSAEIRADRVFITIADSGPGVPEDELEKIFAPFYRLESSRSRATGGTGLGLAIVKSCIEACQGSVSCRNGIPTGFEVSIELKGAEANFDREHDGERLDTFFVADTKS